jgi:hypothetical protein
MLRTVPAEICRVSVQPRRWNSSGAGAARVLVAVVAAGQQDLPVWLPQPDCATLTL